MDGTPRNYSQVDWLFREVKWREDLIKELSVALAEAQEVAGTLWDEALHGTNIARCLRVYGNVDGINEERHPWLKTYRTR